MTTILAIIAAILIFRSDGPSGLFIALVASGILQMITKSMMNNFVRHGVGNGLPPEMAAQQIPNGLTLVNMALTFTTIGLAIWGIVRHFL